jgi:class 3 adenylate cyclase
MAFDIDVRHVAPAIKVPTLIFHAAGDQVCHVENARFLARTIEGARYIETPGADHVPWAEDADRFIAEVRELLTGERDAPPIPDRVLATLLFTDVVGSTERAAAIGDARWRELLAEHHRIIRESLVAHGGHEVDMAGDGILATFDGPARAISSARAIQRASAQLGIEVRAGVHTGEIERLDDNVAGIAVHIGARVAGAAGPGEVWVTSIVPQLTGGSGLRYLDRGTHELKGVPEPLQLFEVG